MEVQTFLNLFSSPLDSSFFKTNIMSQSQSALIIDKDLTYTEYIKILEELKSYRSNDLVETVLDLFAETVKTAIIKSDKLVTIQNNEEATHIINKILSDIDYIDFIYSILMDYIYYGSYSADYSIKIEEILGNDTKYSFKLSELLHKYSAISFPGSNKLYVLNRQKEFKELDKSIYLITNGLKVKLDKKLPDQKFNDDSISRITNIMYNQVDSDIYETDSIPVGKPLFLNIIQKLKTYTALQLIVQLLTLMKLIEQDTWLINTQRMSDSDSIIKLCNQVKSLITQKSDYTLLTGANLDIQSLIYRLFDNARVIPDVSSNLSSMQKFQAESITDKIQQLQNYLEPLREDILSYVGFPKDFYAGSTSKWEVQRQSDRFNTKVKNYINSIRVASTNFVQYLMNKLGYKGEIIINFITDSPADLADKLQRLEINTSAIRNFNEIIEVYTNVSENYKERNPKILKLFKELMNNVDSNLSESLNDGFNNKNTTPNT